MLRLCVLAVLLFGANAALLGLEKCTWGPSYWCENFQQADECGATQHCHERVWTQGSLPSVVDDSDACTFCKDMVSDVKNFLESNETQDTILQYFNRACDFLPDTYSQQECKKVEQHYLDQFEQCVDANIDPDTICKLCRLCSSDASPPQNDLVETKPAETSEVSLKSSAESLQSSDKVEESPCEICEMIAGYVQIFLKNNATEEEIQQLMENDVCPQLGEFSDMCKTLVDQYLPQIYEELVKAVDPATICKKLGLCKTNSDATAVVTPEPTPERVRAKASPSCIMCEFIMSKLDDMLAKNATEEEIVQAVEKVCSILPKSVQTECDNLVEQYGPAIIHLLVNDASPSVVCGFLGLCGSSDSLYKLPLGVGDSACTVCDLTLGYIHSLLEKKDTQEDILHVVEKACNYLSGELAQKCNDMIEEYGPNIVKLMADDLTADRVCKALGVCQAGADKVDGLVHLYKSSDNY